MTVTCGSTTHTECIVVFPLQQWSREVPQCYVTRTLSILLLQLLLLWILLLFPFLVRNTKIRPIVIHNTVHRLLLHATVSYRSISTFFLPIIIILSVLSVSCWLCPYGSYSLYIIIFLCTEIPGMQPGRALLLLTDGPRGQTVFWSCYKECR